MANLPKKVQCGRTPEGSKGSKHSRGVTGKRRRGTWEIAGKSPLSVLTERRRGRAIYSHAGICGSLLLRKRKRKTQNASC